MGHNHFGLAGSQLWITLVMAPFTSSIALVMRSATSAGWHAPLSTLTLSSFSEETCATTLGS